MKEPRILLLDIENTPALGRFFGKVYETNILQIEQQSYILSFAYCWFPDRKVRVVALSDFKGYKRGDDCEDKLLDTLWKLLDEADFVVTQNGQAFDIKHINTRFAFHRMSPPSPYKQIDTLLGLRRAFNLPSNKLDFVCTYFGFGGKLPHTGKDLWLGCMAGDRKDWRVMKKYNAHDVYPLLYKLYELLRPWTTAPSLNLAHGDNKCPKCGATRFHRRGWHYTRTQAFPQLNSLDCGSWFRGAPEKLTSKIVYH